MSVSKSFTDPIEMQPRAALRAPYRMAVLGLLLLIAAEVFLSNRQESQTWDESAHLYAGYEYWTHADFGRNPEHPPLAKLVAASALLPLHPAEPAESTARLSKTRDFFNGSKFLYSADADLLLARSRGMLLLFPLALAFAIFAAGYEMFGPEAGLVAMLLFALEPMILANSGLVTTDIPLSCTLFVSVFAWYRYLKRPTAARLAVCAVAAGLTLVAKHSGVFVIPIFFVLALADMLRTRGPEDASRSPRISPAGKLASLATAFAVIAAVSYCQLWAFYGFRYAARPAGLSMLPTTDAYIAAIPVAVEREAIAFCARHHLLPEAYLYGWTDILQIPGTRITFLFGKLYLGSRWFLFPALILIKSTIPLLVLLVLVPFAGIWRHRREFLFLAIPAAFYFLIAVASGMNPEARYILPMYPFCILLAASAGLNLARRSRRWTIAVAALLVSAAASSLHAFPDYLAYANEAFGGPSQSYRELAGSNNDWSQGLKWVKTYLDQNHVSDCWFDSNDPYIDPAYYGIHCKPLISAWFHHGFEFPGQVPPAISGTVLINATELSGRNWGPDKLNPYAQFIPLEPDAKPGNIVLVYHGTFSVPLLAAYSLSAEATRMANSSNMAEAVAKSEEAARLAPDSANIQAGLGLTLIEAGRNQEGQQVNTTALRLARSVHPEFQGQLIRLLEKPGMTRPPSK